MQLAGVEHGIGGVAASAVHDDGAFALALVGDHHIPDALEPTV
jgi:hypothetical protein